jgi:hypothetical protein
MKYSKGICWVDDTRIPFDDDVDLDKKLPKQDGGTIYGGGKGFYRTDETSEYKTGGRFTPSLLVCDDMLNDGKTYGNLFKQTRNKDTDGGTGNSIVRGHKEGESNGVFDNGTSSSRFYDLDKWFDKVINEIC